MHYFCYNKLRGNYGLAQFIYLIVQVILRSLCLRRDVGPLKAGRHGISQRTAGL